MDVTGSTTLSDVNITGDLMAELLKIDSVENSINIEGPDCISSTNEGLCDTQTLYLQKNLAGNVDVFDGKISLLTDGTIKTQSIVAKVYAVEETEENNSVGSTTLAAGQNEITVATNVIKENSKIFITPTTNTQSEPLFVKEKAEGKEFTVGINNTINEDIEFDWWIIDTK